MAGQDADACPGKRRPCCRRRGGGGGALVEPAALAALLGSGGYGYDLRRTILDMSDGQVDVDTGGLYRSLRRLEAEGAVVSSWADDGSGPRRREYELTDAGRALARQWLAALAERKRLDELLVDLLERGLSADGTQAADAAGAADAGGADGDGKGEGFGPR